MSYVLRHQKADGTVITERRGISVLEKFPCPPVGGGDATARKKEIDQALRHTRKTLHDPKGYEAGRNSRLVARIPPEVYNHVLRNEGHAAANDVRYLIRASKKLGINPVVSKGKF